MSRAPVRIAQRVDRLDEPFGQLPLRGLAPDLHDDLGGDVPPVDDDALRHEACSNLAAMSAQSIPAGRFATTAGRSVATRAPAGLSGAKYWNLAEKIHCVAPGASPCCAAMPVTSKAFIRTTVVLLIVGFLTVLGIVAAALFYSDRTETGLDELVFALELRREALGTLVNMQRAETGQRGFLLTQDEAYLEPFNAAVANLRAQLALMKTDAVSLPAYADAVSLLEAKTDEKLAELRETLELVRAGRLEDALAIVRSDRGKLVMDEINSLANGLIEGTDRLVQLRLAETKSSAALLYWILLGGGFLILIVVGGTAWTAWRYTKRAGTGAAGADDAQRHAGRARSPARRRAGACQRGDPALRLHRQPRSALAARQHHGLHQRARDQALRRCGRMSASLPTTFPPCGRSRTRSNRRCRRRSPSSAHRPEGWTVSSTPS